VTDEGVRQTQGFAWPRYLISFNDHIDGLSTLGSQPKSIISKYCQATRDRCDIVEFAELTLLKEEKRQLKKLARTRKGAVKQFAKETFKMAPKFVVMAAPIGEVKVEGENAISEALLDALWDLPRDTMSILQFHLLRPSTKYSTKQNKVLERKDWIKNRLRVFRQQDLFASLAGGFGAAVIEVVSTNPTSLKRLSIPHARIYGTAHVSDKIGFLNSPVPTYVIREGKNKINEFIQIMTQKCLQRLDLECSKLANMAGMLGGRLFELFKIYFRVSTGTILELFGEGLAGYYLGLVRGPLKRWRFLWRTEMDGLCWIQKGCFLLFIDRRGCVVCDKCFRMDSISSLSGTGLSWQKLSISNNFQPISSHPSILHANLNLGITINRRRFAHSRFPVTERQ
jgi:hypothetical protein